MVVNMYVVSNHTQHDCIVAMNSYALSLQATFKIHVDMYNICIISVLIFKQVLNLYYTFNSFQKGIFYLYIIYI